MAEKNIRETMLKHYNSLLDTELNQQQQEILFAYIDGADMSTTADLPKCKRVEKFYNYLDGFLEKKKGKNLPLVLRFLELLYEKEGYEGFAETIADCVQYSYKGIKVGDFFEGELALGAEQKIVYYLYELYDQIHLDSIRKYRERCDSLYESNPAEFEAVALEHPAPHVRLRAASVLFGKDPTKYGRVIHEAVPAFVNGDETKKLFEELFNSACITNFANEILNGALKDEWPKSMHTTTHTMSYNLFFKDDFVNRDLFQKDYPYYDNCRCKFDFFRKVAEAVGIDDLMLCRTVISYCSNKDDDLKYAVEFLADYPEEMSLRVFQSYPTADYSDFDTLDKFRRLFHIQKKERAPIVKAIEDTFDNVMRYQFERALCSEDEETGEAVSVYCGEVLAYVLEGDKDSFQTIDNAEAGPELHECLNGCMYGISEFLGYFAEEPTLKDFIRRYLQAVIAARVTYSYARLIHTAVKQYNWDGDKIVEYCFGNIDMSYEAVLLFFDEMLLSDKERKSKNRYGRAINIITEQIAASLMEPCKGYIRGHKQETYDFFQAITDYYDCGVINAYGQLPELDPAPLVRLLTIKQKLLRERVVKVIGAFPNAAPLIEELMSHKRKDVRGYADKAMSALENLNAFAVPGAAAAGMEVDAGFDAVAYAEKNTPKNTDKLLSGFTDPGKWPPVKYAGSGETAPIGVLKCYVAMYAGSKEMQRMFSAEKLRPCLDAAGMKELALSLFRDWWSLGEEDVTLWNGQEHHISRGGDTKTKGVMTLLSIHGGSEGVELLKQAVKQFDMSSRSAMAGDAVRALGVSQSTMALVAVDNMARVFRNKLVRRVAGETIAAAAESMGITVDDMSDKIVPTLGLDQRGEGELDLGTEKLTVKIDSDLKASLFRADGKLLKKFPDNKYTGESNSTDGWTYDTERYDLAKSDFNLLRKELKSLVKIQTERLELSLSKARTWDYAGFHELFIRNPIMQRFASSLVFGVYEEDKLAGTFRYSGDGTFSDSNDEEFSLPETARIRIAHPLDLTADQIDQWWAQLSDYEVRQPFPQLNRPTFDNAACSGSVVDLFQGTAVTGYFIPRMLKYDWFIGGAGDGGGFYCIYYEDKNAGYSACLAFENDYPYMGNLTDCSPTIGTVTFFPTGAAVPSYDFSIDDFNITKPSDVPRQVYSEIIYRVSEAVKACEITD